MYKILKASKDTYITNRVIKDVIVNNANCGRAGSLDLFKLYGYTSTGSIPNIELSRLLIKFNLDSIRTLVSSSKLDINHSSFNCQLKLFDVYGGQPTPSNFYVTVHPLSRSFDEGLGKDVVFYGDNDTANFLTGSKTQGPWLLSGANLGGGATSTVDYITSIVSNNVTSSMEKVQFFETGIENLTIDVTNIVSATIANLIPDEGFRIALTSSLENDTKTYFVKRFASRTAYNEDKHPQLIFKFDDSIDDDTNNIIFNTSSSIFLYNYNQDFATNLISSSITLTGSNCILLKLITEISGGYLTLAFTGSQAKIGSNYRTGIYYAPIFIPITNQNLNSKLLQSGSVKFTPIWCSLDSTVAYLTGSSIFAYPQTVGSSILETKRYVVNVLGLKQEFSTTESTILKVNVFSAFSPKIKKVKTPIELSGLIIHNAYYSVRDATTNEVRIPFDKVNKSTKLSSDGDGMYFMLDFSNLTSGRSYVIDIMFNVNGNEQIYRDVSQVFRVI